MNKGSKQLGYVIDISCTACGACKVTCPVHCISKGFPYVINQVKCIKCGKCVDRCWRNLIKLQEIK